MAVRVAVGCPIRERAWIFPQWVDHVRAAFANAGVDPYWMFVVGVGPEGDDGTRNLVDDLCREGGTFRVTAEPPIRPERYWDGDRYQQMAGYRNRLLGMVRAHQPDYFLSLDSDILIHPEGLVTLLDSVQQFNAVGGKAYLSTTSPHITTYAHMTANGWLARQDADDVFAVDVLMAMKLMTPAAYNVDYSAHMFGEDIGWSNNCRAAGLRLGWDGRVTNRHVMERE